MNIINQYSINIIRINQDWNDFYANKNSFNREVAFENLIDIISVYRKYDIDSFAIFGTLLGLVREGELLVHDHDVDIGFFDYDLVKLINVHPELVRIGFRILRESENSETITYERNDEYVDLYLFSSFDERPQSKNLAAFFPRKYILPLRKEEIFSKSIYLPNKSKKLLRKLYGPLWRLENKDSSYPSSTFLLKLLSLFGRVFPRFKNNNKYQILKHNIIKYLSK
jgi:hypothetical protein